MRFIISALLIICTYSFVARADSFEERRNARIQREYSELQAREVEVTLAALNRKYRGIHVSDYSLETLNIGYGGNTGLYMSATLTNGMLCRAAVGQPNPQEIPCE